jgi:ABC-type antimicrobial peptide transport system permease subunit
VTLVSVQQRIPEMGVRMALGAGPGDVIRLVLKHGLTRTALGLALGLALGWTLARTLESYLFQVQAEDAWSFTVIPAFLLLVCLLAYLIPARRVALIDPLEALRGD